MTNATNTCKLTECQGKPKCRRCKANDTQRPEVVAEFEKSLHGDFPVLNWKDDYQAQIGDKFVLLRSHQVARKDAALLACVEALEKSIDNSPANVQHRAAITQAKELK